ncbi:MAG: hypothetical protein NC084_04380 [Bacteroides sp.]|nr:hypothetical protein [Eubacterium sp.]MCM1417901.1 hypothetical protein [Roseburia sp.]MCM1461935.1 hypothetical protein [Bacteroides sp.]
MPQKRRTIPLTKHPELRGQYQINRLLQTLEYDRNRNMEYETELREIRAYQAYLAELLKLTKK